MGEFVELSFDTGGLNGVQMHDQCGMGRLAVSREKWVRNQRLGSAATSGWERIRPGGCRPESHRASSPHRRGRQALRCKFRQIAK